MALAVTLKGNVKTGRGAAGPEYYFEVLIVASGSYTTGGDTLDLSGIFPGGSKTTPQKVTIDGEAGYMYRYVKNTKMSDGKMKVFIPTAVSGDSPFAQHSAAAYNAAVTGDTITAMVVVQENAP